MQNFSPHRCHLGRCEIILVVYFCEWVRHCRDPVSTRGTGYDNGLMRVFTPRENKHVFVLRSRRLTRAARTDGRVPGMGNVSYIHRTKKAKQRTREPGGRERERMDSALCSARLRRFEAQASNPFPRCVRPNESDDGETRGVRGRRKWYWDPL